MRVRSLDPRAIARRIEYPLRSWKGHCHEIACALVKHGFVPGVAVYGHYRGPIHDDTIFAKYKPLGFCRHGWIITEGNRIVDPTRWCFEKPGTKPYIHATRLGVDGRHEEYDEGGDVWREQCRRPCPDPKDKPTKPVKLCFEDRDTENVVAALLDLQDDVQKPTLAQVFWLSNLPMRVLGCHIGDIYGAIDASGHAAYIPIDNRRAVERKEN